jgi:uncharacterized membrane protein YbhN (UPF0104 family)
LKPEDSIAAAPRGALPRLRLLGPLIGVALLAGAAWVLLRELHELTLQDMVREIRSFPPGRLLASLGLSILGYLALAAHDLIALPYLGHRLPLKPVLLTSSLGYALANSIPFAFFVGGSVRYRFYSRWGLTAKDTTALVLFNILTYCLGLAAGAALAFTLEPRTVPRLLGLGFASTRPLGLTALAVLAAYLGWSAHGGRLRLGARVLAPPPLATSIRQLAVSLGDWTFSSAALFVLLPAGAVSFLGFFQVFLLGQIAALIAQLPGGLGVFDAVMVAMLTPALPTSSVVLALVGYRIVYFLLPLGVATTVLGVRVIKELIRGRA